MKAVYVFCHTNGLDTPLYVSFVTLLLILYGKFKLSIGVQFIGTGEEQMSVLAVATNNGPMK